MITIKNIERCSWANQNLILQKYHDTEWGVPEFNEQKLFAVLSLEVFQAGLRWDLILKRRTALNKAFDNFNYQKIANYSKLKLKRLLEDSTIIRNHAKISAVINNAKRLVQLHQFGVALKNLTWEPVNYTSLDHLRVQPKVPLDYSQFIRPYLLTFQYYQFKRIGPKTLYSYLQAIGVVNDHLISCFRHSQISRMVR